MSILNVNTLQPVGSGQTITVSAANITASSATITASSVTATTVTSSSTSTFSNGLNVTGGLVGIGTNNPTFLLQVQNDSESLARFRRENTGSNQGGIIVGNQSRAIKITGGNDGLIITDNTLSQERLRIDSSGNVGIGTATPSNYFSYDLVVKSRQNTGGVTIAANSTSDTNYLMFADGTSGNAAYRGYINYVHSDDSLNIASAGSVRATLTSTGNVQIANGNLVFSTAGTGIDFSATANSSGTMTSELLSDYEEGTFTPSLTFGGGSTGIAYASRNGTYVKIGKTVIVRVGMLLSNKGSSTGTAVVSGLPFTVESISYADATGCFAFNNMSGLGGGPLVAICQNNQSAFNIFSGNSTSRIILADTNFANSTEFYGTITYTVA